MKAKIIFRKAIILFVICTISVVTGCKKDRTTEVSSPDTSSLQQLAKDDAQIQASDNEITTDVNNSLSSTSAKSIDSIPAISSCTITIDTIGVSKDTLQITMYYNGYNTLHNFTRTGTVIVTKLLGKPWSQAGCAVNFKYINLSVTKNSTGKTFIFNGNRQYHSFVYICWSIIMLHSLANQLLPFFGHSLPFRLF